MTILGVTNSFTGPAEALELVGDHAYAYSGDITTDAGGSTMLDFTSGNYYFVGTLQILTTDASGEDAEMDFKLNGVTVVSQKYSNTGNGPAGIFPLDVIIPAYTDVSVGIAGDGRVYSTALVGRIYRS